MASNKVTLVDLEDKKQFLFNYKKKISGFKFIRWGNNREAVVRSRVEKRIKPYDSCAFEKFMQEKRKEKDLKCDFWYSKEEGDKILRSSGLSVYTDIKKMQESLNVKPKELWQLEEHSPFPDEVEIIVLEDFPYKGYIKPKEDSNTTFTKDNIIEMLSSLPWKKYTQELGANPKTRKAAQKKSN